MFWETPKFCFRGAGGNTWCILNCWQYAASSVHRHAGCYDGQLGRWVEGLHRLVPTEEELCEHSHSVSKTFQFRSMRFARATSGGLGDCGSLLAFPASMICWSWDVSPECEQRWSWESSLPFDSSNHLIDAATVQCDWKASFRSPHLVAKYKPGWSCQ